MNALIWSNGVCNERDKRGGVLEKKQGPIAEKYHSNKWNILIEYFLRNYA